MIVAIAPSLNPVSKPTIFSSLAPDLRYAPGVFSSIFLADVPPVVWVLRDVFTTVGTVPQIFGYPSSAEFVEELFESVNWGWPAYDVVEVLILCGKPKEAFADKGEATAIKNIKFVEDEVNNVGWQAKDSRGLRGSARSVIQQLPVS